MKHGLFSSLFPVFVLCLSLIYKVSFTQSINDFDTVSITSCDVYTINSVGRTNISNGRNRSAMIYTLPPNTKYAMLQILIDNSDFQTDKKNYQSLMSKLAQVANNPYVLLTGAVMIETMSPNSSGRACDFYILKSTEEKGKFLEKGSPWKYKVREISVIDRYSRLNTQSFFLLVNVDDLTVKNELILAFQNHSYSNSCKLILDIVALVSRK
jgi:hypothetical protein